MTTLGLITKAMLDLRDKKTWANFDCFWNSVAIGDDGTNIERLKQARKVLAYLHNKFEERVLSVCKHQDARKYETFEICNACEATRQREDVDTYSMGYRNGKWGAWKF